MSHKSYAFEIQANLERSENAIEAAEKLLSDGYPDFAASRAYYAVFYAATALLLNEDMEFSKHSGVIAAIHKGFVKTGRLERETGKELNWLFELRNIGDYGVTIHVPQQEARRAIEAARRFFIAVQTILQEAANGK